MKRSYKLALVLLAACSLALFISNTGHSQRMRMSIDDRVKHLTEQLSLTDDQKDSVKIIYEASDKQRNEIFAARGGDRGAMREQMKKIMSEADEKIEALLTDEQKTAYDKIKKERPQMGAPPARREHEK